MACDHCSAQIGQAPIPLSNSAPVTVDLHDWRNPEHPQKKTHHFCNEACLSAHLDARRVERENAAMASSLSDVALLKLSPSKATYWEVNMLQSDGRDISYKERNSPKEYFLDEQRKSFPIMNCQDVKAAVHAWGRYKGSMSFEQFKAKLTRRAHELGCSLPDKWGE